MKIALALFAVASLTLSAFSADAAIACRDAKGRAAKCPPAAAATTPAVAGAKKPVCKTGKACGNSCIAKDKVCHKT